MRLEGDLKNEHPIAYYLPKRICMVASTEGSSRIFYINQPSRCSEVHNRFMALNFILTIAAFGAMLNAQSDARELQPILSKELQNPEVTGFQLRQYAMKRVPPLSLPRSAQEWTAESG